MRGTHLRITVVHDPNFVNLHNGTAILPRKQWFGFIIDQIKLISDKAGFSYTLHAPSGFGKTCVGNTSLEWATQYDCAIEDVIRLNRTDVYWSIFYARTLVSSMTTPFLADMGLSILVDAPEEAVMQTMLKIFSPISPSMWIATLFAALFVAGVMWLREHEFGLLLEDDHDYTISSVEDVDRSLDGYATEPRKKIGFLTKKSLKGQLGFWVRDSIYALLNLDKFKASTVGGEALGLAWCFFAVVFIASYTANLASILTTHAGKWDLNEMGDLIALDFVACVRAKTAYALNLQIAFPDLKLCQVLGTTADMLRKLKTGKHGKEGTCDAVVDALPQLLVARNLFANRSIQLRGAPLRQGVTDFAAGVGLHVDAAVVGKLSHWITQLRTCSPADAQGACYLGSNLDLLWQFWRRPDKAAPGDDKSLKLENFALPLILIACVGFVNVAAVVFSSAFRARVSVRRRGRLAATLKKDALLKLRGLVRDGAFDVEKLAATYARDAAFRAKCDALVGQHFLVTDVAALCAALEERFRAEVLDHVLHEKQRLFTRCLHEQIERDHLIRLRRGPSLRRGAEMLGVARPTQLAYVATTSAADAEDSPTAPRPPLGGRPGYGDDDVSSDDNDKPRRPGPDYYKYDYDDVEPPVAHVEPIVAAADECKMPDHAPPDYSRGAAPEARASPKSFILDFFNYP
ncbi:hypothetical protein M885DRAFT_562049 [Pelagophyceae sp. CCMP2097]|nr:hypothetical protein M885DRAFT_562049 [Pelagophyceae sp. CCMP2097]